MNARLTIAALTLGWTLLYGTLPASAVTISTFTGGDPGEGLDFSESEAGNTLITNLYAVNALGAPGFTVQGLTFTDEAGEPNVTITANSAAGGGGVFGGSANDVALAGIMNSLRFSSGAPTGGTNVVTVDYNVVVGQTYRLMLLMGSVSNGGRIQDISVEGIAVGDNVSAPNTDGTLLLYEYTALDSITNVVIGTYNLLGDPGAGDPNPVLNALVVQEVTFVPEPGTAALLGLGALCLMGRARRRRAVSRWAT